MDNKDMPAFMHRNAVWTNSVGGNESLVSHGLTKREYIAAMAMQGLLSNTLDSRYLCDSDLVADHSIIVADALLKQLEESE